MFRRLSGGCPPCPCRPSPATRTAAAAAVTARHARPPARAPPGFVPAPEIARYMAAAFPGWQDPARARKLLGNVAVGRIKPGSSASFTFAGMARLLRQSRRVLVPALVLAADGEKAFAVVRTFDIRAVTAAQADPRLMRPLARRMGGFGLNPARYTFYEVRVDGERAPSELGVLDAGVHDTFATSDDHFLGGRFRWGEVVTFARGSTTTTKATATKPRRRR
jgi:hypothetical protein